MPTFELWKEKIVPGVVLMAHPMLQGQLGRSLILILESSPAGVYGLVVNKPCFDTLRRTVHNLPDNLLSAFGSNAVFFGGLVRRLQYLHSDASSDGQPVPFSKFPFFAGGRVADAYASVKENPLNRVNYSFYAGCCTWTERELETELRRGMWTPLRTQPDLLVSMCNYYVRDEERKANAIKPFHLSAVAANDMQEQGEEDRKDPLRQYWLSEEAEEEVDGEEEDEEYDLEDFEDQEGGGASDVDEEAGLSAKADKAVREENSRQYFAAIEEGKARRTAQFAETQAQHLQQLSPEQLQQAKELTATRDRFLARPSGMVPLRINAYRYAAHCLGEQFAGFAELPPHVDSSVVEPSDAHHEKRESDPYFWIEGN